MDDLTVHISDPHPSTEKIWARLEESGAAFVEFDDQPQSYLVESQLDTAVKAIGGNVASLDGRALKVYVLRYSLPYFTPEDIFVEGEDPSWTQGVECE